MRKPLPQQHLSRNKLIVAFVSLFLLALVSINILMAAQVSDQGLYVKSLENKIQQLEATNQHIRSQIYQASSLTQIIQYAQAQGYSNNQTIIKISPHTPVAYHIDQ